MIAESRTIFLVTSSLVKLYVLENDSHIVVAHAEFEFLSAIGFRSKDGELTSNQYEQLRSAFYSGYSLPTC